MGLNAFKLGIGRGLGQFKRQTPIHILATLTLSVALSLAGLAWSIHVQIDRVASRASAQVQIVVFLQPAPSDDIEALARQVSDWDTVVGVRSVSSAEALQRLSDILGQNSDILEGLGQEVIPPLLELQIDREGVDQQVLAQLKNRLELLPGVEEAAFSMGWADRMGRWSGWIDHLGQALTAALILSGLFIVYTSIRLTVLARVEEISILKLIGATNWFIRGPYLIQGAVSGLVAAGLAAGLMSLYQAALNLTLSDTPLSMEIIQWRLVLFLATTGAGAGLAGAWIGLGRMVDKS